MQERREMCVLLKYLLKHPNRPPIHLKLLPMYKLAHLPLPHLQDSHNHKLSLLRRCATDVSIRYRPLAQIDLNCVYITYLHVCMRQYMRFFTYRKCHESNKPAHFLKFHKSFRCSHTQSMDVDKDETKF